MTLPKEVAVVENTGKFPGCFFHESVKDTEKRHYIRTELSVINAIKKDKKHRSVKEVKRELDTSIME